MNFRTTATESVQTYSKLTVTDQPLPLIADVLSSFAVDDSVIEEWRNWLSFHRLWGQLPADVLTAIAQSLQCFRVEPQTLIYQEGQKTLGYTC
ncbi:hypothetical protein [Phormidesmis priestleyi]|uniref:hypothetical protein n=1 Tax=Phormidesmis priestleyi TaxID=268141 RepID=UPI001E334C92|nr:hypothetical protein [Phormidesmis priestleyi]